MTSRWCTTTWKRSPPVPEEALTGLLVRFAAELRTAGLAVGSGDVLVYCSALARLDPSDLVDLYWAGRATLVRRPDDIARYDEVFRRFFLGTEGPGRGADPHAARVGAGPGRAGDPRGRAG